MTLHDPGVGGDRTLIPADDLDAVVERLLSDTLGPVQFTRLVHAPDPAARLTATADLAGQRQLRAIYAAPAAAGEFVAEWAKLGEEQRISDAIATPFACFGHAALLTPQQWGSHEGPYLLVRERSTVAAFEALFTRLWHTSDPLVIDPGHEAQLLELLREGLLDEAIAGRMGVPLRTVRRRIATLMARYGANSRGQLTQAPKPTGAAKPAHRSDAPDARPRTDLGDT
ncbi:hypothetical protein ACMYYO_13710 [Dermacoccaceae bacterium W4C1]